MTQCPKCKGNKHIRKGRVWVRCDCVRGNYIKDNIRCGETSYPPELDKQPPLPLKDLVIAGDYHAFRKTVWRSLSHYEASDLLYEYFDAYRLVEIFLGQDATYARVRDFDTFNLVIVALGVSDLPNRMLPSLMCQLLTLRKMSGKPTWVYTSKVGVALREAYGNDLSNMLQGIGVTASSGLNLVTEAKTRNLIDE